MEIKTHWVGDRPQPWFLQILDDKSGDPFNMTGFTSARIIMKDTDNRETVFSGENVVMNNITGGEVRLFWPADFEFERAGRYVLQLELSGNGVVYKTSTQEILVRELGGVTK